MQKQIILNNGNKIPTLGLGTWQAERGVVGRAVEYAVLEAGYRHIDCAARYDNEPEIGEALGRVVAGGVAREELFVTSKLWNTEHRPENVEKACRKTLADLGLEYLDLYLVHWGLPFAKGNNAEPMDEHGMAVMERVPIQDTWRAMEGLVKKGLVKSVGVSNFTVMMLMDLLAYAEIVPAMNQVELHPYLTQKGLLDFCRAKGIAVTAYSPLGSSDDPEGKMRLMNEPVIVELAKKYGKTAAQILLHWAVARGTVVIPKSTRKERIKENSEIFDFDLTADEMERVEGLNRNHRFLNPVEWWGIDYFG